MSDTNTYQRNLVKERWQDEILSFVYHDSVYNKLIFTGGTCLRKAYGLNRLSEDLDFDIPMGISVDITMFANNLGKCLSTGTKISGNNATVFVKFPDNIFVRCDFSKVTTTEYHVQKNLITAGNRQFFVTAYDLPTLFANKIVAFLSRNFFKGKFQTIPFKGRDIYDMYWLLQLSAKTGYTLKPNVKRLTALLQKKSLPEIRDLVKAKVELVDPQFVYDDLYPLVETKEFLSQFLQDFRTVIIDQLDYVLR
ncbi:MAG: nucleotidyl transferase AbiEii/AbiGii toxin family protein [Candidatus Gottesmanbacteria bacterium]|nr:nucleotidyl transferase AbiEii/AbiGii toxin family protein [Candidatus Gottesmanbacteria bacterium]